MGTESLSTNSVTFDSARSKIVSCSAGVIVASLLNLSVVADRMAASMFTCRGELLAMYVMKMLLMAPRFCEAFSKRTSSMNCRFSSQNVAAVDS